MTISELITKLQETRRAFGDLRVVVFDYWGMRDPTPDDVSTTMADEYDSEFRELQKKTINVVDL